MHYRFLTLLFLFPIYSLAEYSPDFTENARVPTGGRGNIYELNEKSFQSSIYAGKISALEYPVNVTALVMPYDAIKKVIEGVDADPIRTILGNVFGKWTGINTMNDLFLRAGLHDYPAENGEGVYYVPRPNSALPEDRMGMTRVVREGVSGFTISCAACHSSNLFGKRIIGMPNRFPKANDFFHYGKIASRLIEPGLFSMVLGATKAEKSLYRSSRRALSRIETTRPEVDGLDSSLAQVALSLSHRNQDPYATYNSKYERNPRFDELRSTSADVKPGVWWNVKYKNRWLSDGSVVSGNPIFTNFLWNEIGRGTDLHVLEKWLNENTQIMKDLTTAVFASEAPKYTDFFDPSTLIAERVHRGNEIFKNRCSRCHGTYEPTVKYPDQTKVMDVGTDPLRYQGMVSLAKALNPLQISKNFGTVIKPQKGYVPPPLVGIWARWPYLHNGSIPNLCALLLRASERPKVWYGGEANHQQRDFDSNCVGYPLGSNMPSEWALDQSRRYDASKSGLSNAGHDEGIILKNGKELLTSEDKQDLIEYLKTL